MSARNKHGECVYCGRQAKLTRDHLPPRNLFGNVPVVQLITVRCCSDCNCAASLDDEYFRLNLALRDDIGDEPDVREIVPAVMRSLQHVEAPGFRQRFLSGLHQAAVTTPAGLFLGSRLAYDVDLDRMSRVPRRIVRGLFNQRQGRRLPEAYDVHTYAAAGFQGVTGETGEQFRQMLQAVLNTEPQSVGRVFSYWVVFQPEEPNVSIWLTLFYRRVVFISFTLPAGEEETRPNSRSSPELKRYG